MEYLIEYQTAQLTELDNTLPAYVNNAGHYYITTRDYHTERPKGRADYQIIYLVQGNMDVIIGGIKKVIGPGSILLFKPYESQSYTYLSNKQCEAYWIHFYGTMIPKILKELNLDNCSPLLNIKINDFQLTQCINSTIVDLIFAKPNCNCSCLSNLFQILSIIGDSNKQSTKNEDHEYDQERFRNILLQMHNSSTKLSLSDYAKIINLSTSRFSHLFKSVFGVSPNYYQTKVKIQRAKFLLSERNYSIKTIAEMLGYEDPFYFSRLFKKYTGLSPQNYRDSLSSTKNQTPIS